MKDFLKTSIVFASSSPLVRNACCRLLDGHGFERLLAVSVDDLAASDLEWDDVLLVLDLDGPDPDVAALKAHLAGHPETAVVALSRSRRSELVLDSVAAGARGFVTKDCDVHELLAVIALASAGGMGFSAGLVADMRERVEVSMRTEADDVANRYGLSAREREVLELLPTSHDLARIACSLSVSRKTVQNNISSLYRKLGVRNRAELVATAIGLGLVRCSS